MLSPIIIVGAGSNTAGALVPMLAQEVDAKLVLLTSSDLEIEVPEIEVRKIDVTKRVALKNAIIPELPGTIINLVAHAGVDACEVERKLAWKLNVTLVEDLVRISRLADAHLIHVSTDYVFDGEKGPYSEGDVPSPVNYYGKTKLAGENAITSGGIDSTIIRTNVLYGPYPTRPDFVHWVLSSLEVGNPIRVVSDQYSNPTYVDDLAEAILHVLQQHRTGLYHVGGADYVSRYEFAVKIARMFKLDESTIEPITTAMLQQQARRPLRGGLVTLKAQSEFSLRFRGIESGLVSYRHTLFTKK